LLDELRPRTEALGESLHIRERLIVAPAWGRLRAGGVSPGDLVSEGDVIGVLVEADRSLPLLSHSNARFVAWSAKPGRRVAPGTRLAILRSVD
jgi:hypothetical protein